VNHGSPGDTYNKESPINRYFNTLKKDLKNDEMSLDSEYQNDKKLLSKDINIPKFPDLSNTKVEEENFEMNSKDFLENNRILRNELIRNNNFFQKKLNNNFIKEIYDSINYDNQEKKESSYRLNNKTNFNQNSGENFLFFESFNDHIPKIITPSLTNKIPSDFTNKENHKYYENKCHNYSHRKDIEIEYPKNTPEFQKFQTRISTHSFQNEESQRLISKQAESPSFLENSQKKYGKEPNKNYDLPFKCNDKYSETLMKEFVDSKNKSMEYDPQLKNRKSTEIFDENIDENLSKDLKTKLNEHLLFNKESNSKFNRIKKPENLTDNQITCLIDEMTSFKNTNSSIMNQNSDRLKSSPIISILIHESIKKDLKHNNEKKNPSSDFKFLEDYRLESVKNKQHKIQNDVANKNSTTIGLSSIENTDNNSEKPLYVLNMEIISSNCLSPIVKENIINLLKSNSNYVKILFYLFNL